MSYSFKCPTHQNQIISLVCLSNECDQRYLCKECSLNTHPPTHFLESLEGLKNKGFVGLFYDFGSLDIPISQQIELDDSFQSTANLVKINLETALQKFEKNQKEFEKQRNMLKSKISDKCSHLHQYDHIFTQKNIGFKDFSSNFEKGLATIYSFKNDKEMAEVPLIKFKIELLNTIFANYIRLITLLYNNTFSNGLNTYLNQQAEILNKFSPNEVENSGQYISFLDQRFRKEYLHIERMMTDSLSNMSNHINMLMQGVFSIQKEEEKNQRISEEKKHVKMEMPAEKDKRVVYVAKKAVAGKAMLSGNFKKNLSANTNDQQLNPHPYKKSTSAQI